MVMISFLFLNFGIKIGNVTFDQGVVLKQCAFYTWPDATYGIEKNLKNLIN